jgi:O-antigen ligase
MDRERLDGWCERGIIALMLAILAFGPLATGAVRTLEFLILQALTVAALLLWVARLWLRPKPTFLMPPLGWAVLAFAAYAVFRYSTAEIEYVARLELIRVLVCTAIFFVVINNLHRQETVNLVAFVMVFLAMAVALYGLYQFFTGDNRVWHFQNVYKFRATGTYINPNHFAGFLEMLLPLGIAYTLVGRMKPLLRILLGYASLVLLAGIALSVSRGGWIATGLALILFFTVLLLHRGFRIPAAVALVVLLAGGAYAVTKSTLFKERAENTVKEIKTREYSRYQLWVPALKLWQEDRWLGIGPDHFNQRFRSVRPQEIQMQPDRVHNDYLNVLVDWGIAGLVLVLGALAVITYGVMRMWRHVGGVAADLGNRRTNRFAFVLGASFGLVAMLVHSTTDFNMHIPGNAILAVTLLALLASHQRFASESYWTGAGRPLCVAVTIMVLAGVAFLTGAGIRRAQAYYWNERAARLPSFSPAAAAAWEKAFAVEPKDFEAAYQIGECHRLWSWEGGDNYEALARKAMEWFERGAKLNPYDAHFPLRYGMCLDWIGQRDKSWPYYSRAEELDPNGYFTVAHIGWHFIQTEDYAAARPWFERSLHLKWDGNPIAENYLALCHRRLMEAATNSPTALLLKQPQGQ